MMDSHMQLDRSYKVWIDAVIVMLEITKYKGAGCTGRHPRSTKKTSDFALYRSSTQEQTDEEYTLWDSGATHILRSELSLRSSAKHCSWACEQILQWCARIVLQYCWYNTIRLDIWSKIRRVRSVVYEGECTYSAKGDPCIHRRTLWEIDECSCRSCFSHPRATPDTDGSRSECSTSKFFHARWSSSRSFWPSNNKWRTPKTHGSWSPDLVFCGRLNKYNHKRISTTNMDAPFLRLLLSQTAFPTSTLTSVDITSANLTTEIEDDRIIFVTPPPILVKSWKHEPYGEFVRLSMASKKHLECGKQPEMKSSARYSFFTLIKCTVFIKPVYTSIDGRLSGSLSILPDKFPTRFNNCNVQSMVLLLGKMQMQ